jgi:chromosome partitioning protein
MTDQTPEDPRREEGSASEDGSETQDPSALNDPVLLESWQTEESTPRQQPPASPTEATDPAADGPIGAWQDSPAPGPEPALPGTGSEEEVAGDFEAPSPSAGSAQEDQYSHVEVETSRRLAQGEIIALVNQKGGVGKTTSTINLGAALVEEGARVLLVDFDPQGALSVGLGINPNDLDLTVYDLLLDRSVLFQEVVKPTKFEGLDIIPANIDLSAAEVLLVSEVAREQMLRRALQPGKASYNYILIDCPPSLGLLTVNALTAASGVIIPLETEYFALRGMALLLDTVEKVKERLNPELQIEGILATMLDSRTVHGREVLSRVTEAFGDRLFKTIIHKTIRFAEAPVAGEPILTYSPRSPGAQEYRDLAREVMSR